MTNKDFFSINKIVDMASEKAKVKESFKMLRVLYNEMIEAGFTMEEAMAFIAALCKQSGKEDE
jgi:hypothetical protein